MKKVVIFVTLIMVVATSSFSASQEYCKLHTKFFIDIMICLKKANHALPYDSNMSIRDKMSIMKACYNSLMPKYKRPMLIVGTEVEYLRHFYFGRVNDFFDVYNAMAYQLFSKEIVNESIKAFYSGCRYGK